MRPRYMEHVPAERQLLLVSPGFACMSSTTTDACLDRNIPPDASSPLVGNDIHSIAGGPVKSCFPCSYVTRCPACRQHYWDSPKRSYVGETSWKCPGKPCSKCAGGRLDLMHASGRRGQASSELRIIQVCNERGRSQLRVQARVLPRWSGLQSMPKRLHVPKWPEGQVPYASIPGCRGRH